MESKTFSVLIEEELQRKFRAIVVRKGKTIKSVLTQLLEEYIEKESECLKD